MLDESDQMILLRLLPPDLLLLKKKKKLPEVPVIGGNGVGGQPLFHGKVLKKGLADPLGT
jgi:hypothetical protein